MELLSEYQLDSYNRKAMFEVSRIKALTDAYMELKVAYIELEKKLDKTPPSIVINEIPLTTSEDLKGFVS